MKDIEKARVIRDFVLRNDADVTWSTAVFQNVEHRCWRLRGLDWTATVSNLWDVMSAPRHDDDVDLDHRFELSQQNFLEIFSNAEGERILGMSYGSDESEDLVYAYDAGACERTFRHPLALRRFDDERRSKSSTIVSRTSAAA